MEGLVLPETIEGNLVLESLIIKDLLCLDFRKVKFKKIWLDDGDFSYEEFMGIWKRENVNIQATNNSQEEMTNGGIRRGSLNMWYVLVPAIILILGVIVAFIVYY